MQNQSNEEKPSFFTKNNVIEYTKRTIFLIIGLMIMSCGVALSILGALGTSPISSIPYVLNIITGLSVGVTTIIVNVTIVFIEFLLLRKKFKLIAFLQIPACIIFGLLNDLSLSIFDFIVVTEYWQQWLLCIAGIILVAFGVSCEVTAKVTTLPGEGLVLTLCQLLPKVKFGYMKVAVDSTLVIIAVVLSFIFLQELQAVREGTIAAAIFVGLTARVFNKFMIPFGDYIFKGKHENKKIVQNI